jgi:hypothetical protein
MGHFCKIILGKTTYHVDFIGSQQTSVICNNACGTANTFCLWPMVRVSYYLEDDSPVLPSPREYDLLTEAHAKFSVVQNYSRFSLPVYCPPPPHPLLLMTSPRSASCFPSPRHTRREDLEQFPTTESGLLLLIHILCPPPFNYLATPKPPNFYVVPTPVGIVPSSYVFITSQTLTITSSCRYCLLRAQREIYICICILNLYFCPRLIALRSDHDHRANNFIYIYILKTRGPNSTHERGNRPNYHNEISVWEWTTTLYIRHSKCFLLFLVYSLFFSAFYYFEQLPIALSYIALHCTWLLDISLQFCKKNHSYFFPYVHIVVISLLGRDVQKKMINRK